MKRVVKGKTYYPKSCLIIRRQLRRKSTNRSPEIPFKQIGKAATNFRQIAENSNDVFFRFELFPYPHLEYVSPTIEEVCGFTANELCNDLNLARQVVFNSDIPVIKTKFRQSIKDGASHIRMAARIVRKDHQIVWFELYMAPILDNNGNLLAVEGMIRDITHLKRMEEALFDSESRLRAIIDQIGIGIVITDLEGNIVEFNPSMRALLAYPPNKIKYPDIRQYTHPEDYKRERPLFRKLARGKIDRYQVENRLYKSDGSMIWCNVITSLVRDSNKKPKFTIEMIEDITARKLAEQDINRQLAELRNLVALSTKLRDNISREDIYSTLIEAAIEMLQADAGAFIRCDQGQYKIIAANNDLAKYRYLSFPLEDLAYPALQEGKQLLVGHLNSDPGRCMSELLWNLTAQMSCSVLQPITTPEEKIGYILVCWRNNLTFTERESHVLEAIADIADNAFHLLLVLESLEQRVLARTRELTTLYEVSAITIKQLNLQTMLELILNLVISTINADAGAISLVNPMAHKPELIVHKGINQELLERLQNGKIGFKPCDLLSDNTEPLFINDIDKFERMAHYRAYTKLRSYAGIPIKIHGKMAGVLAVFGNNAQQFTVEDMAMLGTIADQISIALENNRLRQQAMQSAILDERERLARDLHDSITQQIYGINLMTEYGKNQAIKGDLEQIKKTLETIGDAALQALKGMRLLIYELHPLSLEKDGFVGSMQKRLDSVEARSGVKASLIIEHFFDLPSSLEEALYYIFQEAVNNILKHASAKNVTIKYNVTQDNATLEIIDDGKGFAIGKDENPGGLGMNSMKERVEKLNGTLSIDSKPGKGTKIFVSVPLIQA
jgi:PAS domain S-box-containing protein